MVACGVSVEEAGSEESAETTNGERRVLASCLHPSSPERAQTSGKSAVRDSAQHGPSEENSEAHVSGPFRAGLLLDGTLHVSAAPLPPLLPSPPANVPLPVYEALSLLGSTAGLLLIAWPLSWSDSEAPWARQMASTSVTRGGGMFVVATGSSCFLAAVLLWMTDFVACDRTGTAFDCDRSLQSAQFLDPCKDERDEGGGFQRACRSGPGTCDFGRKHRRSPNFHRRRT